MLELIHSPNYFQDQSHSFQPGVVYKIMLNNNFGPADRGLNLQKSMVLYTQPAIFMFGWGPMLRKSVIKSQHEIVEEVLSKDLEESRRLTRKSPKNK